MSHIVLYYLLGVNLLALVLYGVDKLKARNRGRRISERTLLFIAFLGGSLGAWLGMKLWRHKTLHWQFAVGIPLMLALHVALALYIAFGGGDSSL